MTGSRDTSVMPALFLILPAGEISTETLDAAQAFLMNVRVASLLLPPISEEAPKSLLEELCALAQRLDTAVLTLSAEDCRELRADGVHLETDDVRKLAALRRRLGDGMILGACCPTHRHLAMEMGEAGADYIGIDQRLEAGGENLLAWWAEMFTVPVVAMHPVRPDEAERLARLGADFIVPSMETWQDADQAERLAARWRAALGQE